MANYQLLKADIDKKVYQNGKQEITGANLNSVLNAMVTTLGAEYQFAGVATIDTNPENPDAKVFYIANGKGTYTNFGSLEVTEDEVVVLYWDSSWHKVSTGIASQAKLSELERTKADKLYVDKLEKEIYNGDRLFDFDYTIAHDNAYCKTYHGTYGIANGYCITNPIQLKKGTLVKVTTAGYGIGVICADYGGGDYAPFLNAVSSEPTEPKTYEFEMPKDSLVAFCGLKSDLQISYKTSDKGIILRLKAAEQEIVDIDNRVAELENADATHIDSNQSLLLRHMMPSYYFDVPQELSDISNQYLDGKLLSINKQDNSLVFVTDTHWTQNKKYSPLLIKYLKDKIGFRNILFGGDLIGMNLSVNQTMLDARVYMNEWLSAFGSDYLFGIGDHDLNTGSIEWNQKMSYQKAFDIYLSKLKDIVTFDTEMINKVADDNEVIEWGNSSDTEIAYLGGVDEFKAWLHFHYSYDDTDKKIRYIVLNTGGPHTYYVNIKVKVGTSGYENNDLYLQMDFLYRQLMTLPEGYSVIILGHRLIHYGHNFQVYGVMLDVARMLSAFKTKTSVSIDCPLTRTQNWYAGGVHTYNFGNAPTPTKVFALCGDTHHDSSCITHTKNGEYVSESYTEGMALGNDAILFINTHCDAFEGADSATGGNQTKAPMVANTITEQSFDIVSWDENKIRCIRIGAGEDRSFIY